LRNDHAALVTIGIDLQLERPQEPARFFLADIKSWKPADYGGQIDLSDIRQACLDVHQRFHLSAFVYDAYQAVLLIEDLARVAHDRALVLKDYRPLRLIEFKFNAEGLSWMAETFLQTFRNRQIDLFEHKDLVDDLMRVQIEEKPIGYKLTARRDEKGHADRAIALGMVLPYAVEGSKVLKFNKPLSDGLGESLI
jgi:type III secretion system FlhB-like substrate exporter